MSEKMRAEFDAWTMEYGFDDDEHMWEAWQASRAALVVELPTSLRYSECGYDYASEAFEETIDVVKLSLDSVGVNYK